MELGIKSVEETWLRLGSDSMRYAKPVSLRRGGDRYWVAHVGEPKPGEKLVGYYNSRVPLSHLREDCEFVFARECVGNILG